MSRHRAFKHNHYVPHLRCKQAELEALAALTESVKDSLTPLIEMPSKEFDPLDPGTPARIDERFKHFAGMMKSSWSERHLFLDLGYLHPSVRGLGGLHPITVMWREATSESFFPPSPIPVVSPDRDVAYKEAVRAVIQGTGVGICLRLGSEHLYLTNLEQVINELLAFYELSPDEVDLIFDFGLIDEDGFMLSDLLDNLPYVLNWRTLTCAGGSFPQDLQGFTVGEHEHPRWEWQHYRDQVGNGSTLPRIPTFGDYTIQHPVYIEPVDNARPSASIRYTAQEHTVIMRGESLFKDDGAKHKQYPAEALMLCEREEFCGAEFSAGDAYIYDKAVRMEAILAREKGDTGGPKQWLYAGINHHLTLVTQQISNLFGI